MRKKILIFVFGALFSGLVFGMMFGLVQQLSRLSAYDPAVEYAENFSNALSVGVQPSALVKQETPVDMAKSLSLFSTIYDDKGKIIVSTATLNGHEPSLPAGVLDYVRTNGQDRLTWQPENGVRSAVVVQRYVNGSTSGFVMVGRSLTEVENRAQKLLEIAVAGWVISLALIGAFVWCL